MQYRISPNLVERVNQYRQEYEEHCVDDDPHKLIWDVTGMFHEFMKDKHELKEAKGWVSKQLSKYIKRAPFMSVLNSLGIPLYDNSQLVDRFMFLHNIKQSELEDVVHEVMQKKDVSHLFKDSLVFDYMWGKVCHLLHARKSGKNYFEHPRGTAAGAADLKSTHITIGASLGHDVDEERVKHEIFDPDNYEDPTCTDVIRMRAMHHIYFLMKYKWVQENGNISPEHKRLFHYYLRCQKGIVSGVTRDEREDYMAYIISVFWPENAYETGLNREAVKDWVQLRNPDGSILSDHDMDELLDDYQRDIIDLKLSPQSLADTVRRCDILKLLDHDASGHDLPIRPHTSAAGFGIQKVIYACFKSGLLLQMSLNSYLAAGGKSQELYHRVIFDACDVLTGTLLDKCAEAKEFLGDRLDDTTVFNIDSLLEKYKQTSDYHNINLERYRPDQQIPDGDTPEEKAKFLFNGTYKEYFMILLDYSQMERNETDHEQLYVDVTLIESIIQRTKTIMDRIRGSDNPVIEDPHDEEFLHYFQREALGQIRDYITLFNRK